MSDKKICPLFRMAIIISNKAASQEAEYCQGEKCQWWYLCSELDRMNKWGEKDVPE